MASILESKAAFEAKGKSHGLSDDEMRVLKNSGIDSLAKLAFAVTTPGVNPGEVELRALLDPTDGTRVSVGSLSSLRRLMFDSQTLAIQQVKAQVEGNENTKKELVPAERSSRIESQKLRLNGYDLTGPLECSHASYDLCLELIEKDSIYYLPPHKFGTRAAEVSREKPGKEIVIDASSLKIHDTKQQENLSIKNEFELSQAMTRRALAADLVGLTTFNFSVMERWHRYLFQHLANQQPPGFGRTTVEQLLRADRQAWVRLAEKVPSIKKDNDGNLPLDKAFDDLPNDSSVNFHLLPMPSGSTKIKDDTVNADGDVKKVKKKKKAKGKGKGKMPAQLKGLNANTNDGDRICYNFNLKHGCSYAKPGEDCKRGKHVCMRRNGHHPQHKCNKRASE